ncbi:MAG: hypothetical protein ACK5V3_17920 [Bdellovibrionales bacterium]
MKSSLFFILLFSSFVWANSPENFKGTWQGTGVYKFKATQNICDQAEFVFAGDHSFIEFISGFRKCGNHFEKFDRVRLDFRDGKFYFGDFVVGEMTGPVVSLRFSAPEADGKIRHWRMSMRREGKHLVYEESRTMEGEVTPLISFVGLLILQE